MEQGDQEGMQTFDGVIEKLIRSGVVTLEGAMPYATNHNNLLLRLGDLGGELLSPPPPEPLAKDEGSMLNLIER